MGKKLSISRQAKKTRRQLRRPVFDQALLPVDISVRFTVMNHSGARKITLAQLYDTGTGKAITLGHSICAPMDEFDLGRGRTIALGRAVRTWWEHEQNTARIVTLADDRMDPLARQDQGAGPCIEEAHANLGVDRLAMDPHAEARQTFTRR